MSNEPFVQLGVEVLSSIMPQDWNPNYILANRVSLHMSNGKKEIDASVMR